MLKHGVIKADAKAWKYFVSTMLKHGVIKADAKAWKYFVINALSPNYGVNY